MFHGCVDGHSAVHGNYALRVASRLTGDRSFAALADSVATTAGMSLVRNDILAGRLPHELPYGYAWFLILDREARTPGTVAVAAEVSTPLRAWIDAHLDGEEISGAGYDNLPLAVHALHRWYRRADPR